VLDLTWCFGPLQKAKSAPFGVKQACASRAKCPFGGAALIEFPHTLGCDPRPAFWAKQVHIPPTSVSIAVIWLLVFALNAAAKALKAAVALFLMPNHASPVVLTSTDATKVVVFDRSIEPLHSAWVRSYSWPQAPPALHAPLKRALLAPAKM
jgi:hypothetical protein